MPTTQTNTLFGSAGSLIISGTADRAAQFNSDGELEASDITSTELSYLDGVTSNIQDQLDDITTLADGAILVGDATNTAQEVTMTGDVTIDNIAVASITADVIVDADVNSEAAIARTKLANGTADVVVVNSATGQMADSAITTNELQWLDNVVKETVVALADNQAAATNAITYDANFDYAIIEYGIERGAGNRRTGRLLVATDASTANISDDNTELGTTGVTFSVNVNGGTLEVQYTSTSTGTAPTLTYKLSKWGN